MQPVKAEMIQDNYTVYNITKYQKTRIVLHTQ